MQLLKRYARPMLVLFMLLITVPALAQTLTTDKPAGEKAWEILLKTGFPLLMTIGAPYFTGWITSGMKKVSPTIQMIITGITSLLAGAVVGQIPDFPLGSESAANMAMSSGISGQVVASMKPETMAAAPLTKDTDSK